MALLKLSLLGDYQMHDAAGTLVTLSAKKSQALLAYLGARPTQLVSRDKIANLLWSSTGPEQARQSLRQLLSSLRKELGHVSPAEKILVEEADFLGLDGSLVQTDVAEFEALIASGTEEALTRATALYEGDFLDGFTLDEERFDQWVLAERDRLHRASLKAHAQLVETQARRGALDEAIGTAQRALRIDIMQESMHRTLMRLYMQSGDLVNALQQYEICARTLKRELRIDPDSETKSLQQQIAALRAKRSTTPPAPGQPDNGDRKPMVLVVEDNLLNRELTNALLKSAGYDVRLAADGAEALMVIGREKVDLMLLDIDLPFIDGHKVLEALKEKGIDVPTIFVSGLPGEEPEVKAFEIGAADFIRKPVKNNVLLARVSRVLKDLEES
ncbi:MAG TPA: response regulator [Thermoanaerobaculia bacterium]|jgi:DNA-binding SARP family transcriptional activator/CheY-like chemotaxis protein|nr:response regulator [Thermoanaerobaculia bacterium]